MIAWPTAVLGVAGLGIGWTNHALLLGGLSYYLSQFIAFGWWRLFSALSVSAVIPIAMLTERYLHPFYGHPWTDSIGLAVMSWAIFGVVYAFAGLIFPGRWLRSAFLEMFPER
jgi:hypothetical protein